jgi:hypothetical protein
MVSDSASGTKLDWGSVPAADTWDASLHYPLPLQSAAGIGDNLTLLFALWPPPRAAGNATVWCRNPAGEGCLTLSGDGALHFASAGGASLTSTAKLARGVWSHIAFIRSATTAAFIINGIESGNVSLPPGASLLPNLEDDDPLSLSGKALALVDGIVPMEAAWSAPLYRREGNRCHLSGVVERTHATPRVRTVTVLPPGCRPATKLLFACNSIDPGSPSPSEDTLSEHSQVAVDVGGVVTWDQPSTAPGARRAVSLDGIAFTIAGRAQESEVQVAGWNGVVEDPALPVQFVKDGDICELSGLVSVTPPGGGTVGGWNPRVLNASADASAPYGLELAILPEACWPNATRHFAAQQLGPGAASGNYSSIAWLSVSDLGRVSWVAGYDIGPIFSKPPYFSDVYCNSALCDETRYAVASAPAFVMPASLSVSFAGVSFLVASQRPSSETCCSRMTPTGGAAKDEGGFGLHEGWAAKPNLQPDTTLCLGLLGGGGSGKIHFNFGIGNLTTDYRNKAINTRGVKFDAPSWHRQGGVCHLAGHIALDMGRKWQANMSTTISMLPSACRPKQGVLAFTQLLVSVGPVDDDGFDPDNVRFLWGQPPGSNPAPTLYPHGVRISVDASSGNVSWWLAPALKAQGVPWQDMLRKQTGSEPYDANLDWFLSLDGISFMADVPLPGRRRRRSHQEQAKGYNAGILGGGSAGNFGGKIANFLLLPAVSHDMARRHRASSAVPLPHAGGDGTIYDDSCAPCPSGKWQGAFGSPTCDDVPAGTFRLASRERDEQAFHSADICANGWPCASANECSAVPGSSLGQTGVWYHTTDESAGTCNHEPLCMEGRAALGITSAALPRVRLCTAFEDVAYAKASGFCVGGVAEISAGTATSLPCPVNVSGSDIYPFPWAYNSAAQLPRPSLRDPDRYIMHHTCPAGRFQDHRGEARCKNCPAGKFQPKPGASFCTPCAVGTFRDDVSRSCDASLGFKMGGAVRDDQFSASSSAQGSAVARLGSAAWCAKPDAAGRPWLQLDLVNATLVHRVELQGSQSSQNDECVTSFKVLHGNRATDPASGAALAFEEVLPAFAGKPLPCATAVDFSPPIAAHVLRIVPLSWKGVAPCLRVELFGCAAPGSSCEACAAGTYGEESGLASCANCPEGKFSAINGVTACIACPEGRFGNVTGAASLGGACKNCPAGKNQPLPGKLSCDDCPDGTFQPREGKSFCNVTRSCLPGERATTSTSTTSDRACFACEAGSFSAFKNAGNCTQCPYGKFQADTNQGFCARAEICTPGRYVLAQGTATLDTVCGGCAASQYSNRSNALMCAACPQSKYQLKVNQSFCLAIAQCAPGTWVSTPSDLTATRCSKCASGHFSNTSDHVGPKCTPCAANSFQLEEGRSFCEAAALCVPGQWVSNASDSTRKRCSYCARDTFSNTSNADECFPCANNTFQLKIGQPFCETMQPCIPGTFVANTSDPSLARCASCPRNHFSTESNSAACTPCPNNTYQLKRGQPFCEATAPCVPGQWVSNSSDATPKRCSPCVAGTFSNISNTLACERCPEGKYQPLPSAAFCATHFACPKGKFVVARGNASSDFACDTCREGFFSETENAANCTALAEPGFYAAGGAKLQCPPGKFSDRSSATTCDSCQAGHFANDGGSTVCTSCESVQCPTGELKGCGGAFGGVCTECSVHTYWDSTTRKCTPCEPGYFCEGGLAYECPIGFFCKNGKQTYCNTAGLFCPSVGLAAASTCPAGSACSAEKIEDACKSGEISVLGKCHACPTGEFPLDKGGCTKCPMFGKLLDCPQGKPVVSSDTFCASCVSKPLHLAHPSVTLMECRRKDVCVTTINPRTFAVETRCEEGYDGPLCAACNATFGSAGGSCVPCPAGYVADALAALLAVAAVGGFLFVIRQSLVPDFDAATLTILRIFENYVQLSGMLLNFQLDWGSSLRLLFGISSAAGGGAPPLLDCMNVGFVTQTAVIFATPLIVPVVVLLLLGACRGFARLWKQKRRLLMGLDVTNYHFIYNGMLALSYLTWPALVNAVFRTFDCSITVGDASFVASDANTRCDTPQFKMLRAFAFVLCLVALAFPIGIAMHLRRHKDVLQTDGVFKSHWFFIYGGFKVIPPRHARLHASVTHVTNTAPCPHVIREIGLNNKPDYFWWDGLVMVRKAMLVAVAVWLGNNAHGLQVWAGLCVLLVAFALQLWHSPYQHPREDRLESLTLGATTVSLMIGLALVLGKDGGMGSGTAMALRFLVGAVNVAVMATAIFQLVAEIRDVRRKKKLLLSAFSMPDVATQGSGKAPHRAAAAKFLRVEKKDWEQGNPMVLPGDPQEQSSNPIHAAAPNGVVSATAILKAHARELCNFSGEGEAVPAAKTKTSEDSQDSNAPNPTSHI